MKGRKRTDLTTPDLVVLSLLMERPWHGYDLNQELTRREVRDWAGISRPQIYYSLAKLEATGHAVRQEGRGSTAGPERHVYAITEAGRHALVQSLGQTEWATQRPPTPFNTWMALARHADPVAIRQVIASRRKFLGGELAKERVTLEAIRAEGGAMAEVAAAIVGHQIEVVALELDWLDRFLASLLPAAGPS